MGRNYKSGHKRQPQDFYATPAWPTEALLETLRRWGIRLPNDIWEPCCGDGAIAEVLKADGYNVVATDLEDRGYGEGGRDFMLEKRLPDGVTAIVTNPPYDKQLLPKFVDHALELLKPVGGVLVLLVSVQWKTAATNSARCRIQAYEASVTLTKRIRWFPGTKEQPKENHCWLIWDHSRPPGPAKDLFAELNAESEPETRWCIECRTPLPSTARADKRHCSATCRKRDSRRGVALRRTA